MQVLVDAKAVVDQGCDGSIIGVVVAGDVNDPNGVFCQVTVSGRDESFAKDAVARAAVEFSGFFCKKDIEIADVAVVRPPSIDLHAHM